MNNYIDVQLELLAEDIREAMLNSIFCTKACQSIDQIGVNTVAEYKYEKVFRPGYSYSCEKSSQARLYCVFKAVVVIFQNKISYH